VTILRAADLFEAYEKKIRENPERYIDDYHQAVKNVADSSAWYKGEPVKFLYQPMFFTKEDIEIFKELTSQMTIILNKVIDEYMSNPIFRRYFRFPSEMEKLILAGSGYSSRFPIARYDIFYPYSEDFKFCEINGDGSSSMNESRELHRIIKESRALDGIIDKNRLYDYELFDSWIDVLLACYREFTGGTGAEKPVIAIMDFDGEGIVSEFEIFKNRMIERGHTTFICDPRELKYINGKLYYGSQKIDLIYRRATTTRIVDNIDSIKDFVRAYLDRAVCVVGGFSSQIIHNKIIFAILHDEKATPFLNESKREFIKRHIPHTVLLEPEDPELIENLLQNKDRYVLKPLDSFAAHGVYIGKDYDRQEWHRLVCEAKNSPYLVQELCSIPQINMLTFENGKLFFEKYNYITGLFMYDQKFSGLYSRAGRKNIIASVAESFTLPNFVAE
jgi:glutathionylspermidine synthase